MFSNKRIIFAHTPGECSYQACRRSIRKEHYLCTLHYAMRCDGKIEECEGGCGRYLPVGHPYCAECDPDVEPAPTAESEPHWGPRDAAADRFWIYLLRLEAEGAGGIETAELYVGQTRDLTCRMMDHVDGKCASTWGRRPGLVWFAEMPNREAATTAEAELKRLLSNDRRAVLRRIDEFQAAAALVQRYPPAGDGAATDPAAGVVN